MKRLAVFVLCGILLAGCGQRSQPTEPEFHQTATLPTEKPAAPTEIPEPEIVLPVSVELAPTDDGYDILQDGQIAGGLVKTELLKDGTENLESYLQSYVQPPLVLEYMSGSGMDNVWLEVSLIAYDPETKTAHEDKHNIFSWNGDYWDLWVNPDFIDNKQETAILREMGLYEPEDGLEKCLTALLELQNRNSYTIQSNTRNYGSYILNETSSYQFYKDGKNWLKLGQIPDEGFDRGFYPTGFMCVDGKYYDNMETEWDENEDILWGESTYQPGALPWIAAFQWFDQEVTYVSTLPAGKGQCITLEVLAPYDQRELEDYGRYQMQFFFDEWDSLSRIKNTVFFHHEREGDYSIEETIQIIPDHAKTVIDTTYSRIEKSGT